MSRRGQLIATAILAGVLGALLANEVRIFTSGAPFEEMTWQAFALSRIGPWISAICALAIYSFLYRENPFYRFFEHLLLGTAMGFVAAPLLNDVILEKCLIPLWYGVLAVFGRRDEAGALVGDPTDIYLLMALVIGLLWYFQFSKKYRWLSRIAVGISVGAGSGLAFKRVFNELMPQLTQTFKSVVVLSGGPQAEGWEAALLLSIENAVFLIGTCSVLVYFFFAFEQRNPVVRGTAKLGRLFLMVAFGAFFGNTFMSRLSALIERFNFLVTEWIRV